MHRAKEIITIAQQINEPDSCNGPWIDCVWKKSRTRKW